MNGNGARIHRTRQLGLRARLLIQLYALLVVLPVFARDKTDVIVMNNGDRMTCEIKGLQDGVLYVSLDYIKGTSSVDWSKVHHLQSNQLFIVSAVDGSVYTGAIKTVNGAAGRPIQIVPVEASKEQMAIKTPDVVDITQTSARLWQRLNGNVTAGVTYSKGNQSRQYNVGSTVEYPQERWLGQAIFNSTFNRSSGTTTSTRNSLDLSALRFLPWNNWYYVGLGDFLQSSVQAIQVQSNLAGGLGLYLMRTPHSALLVAGGLGWENINYSQTIHAIPAENSLAGMVAAKLKLFKFDRTNLTVDAIVFPSLTQPGRVYSAINASYYVKLFAKINWNASIYSNWDNEPPPHFSGSNYGTSSGISYSFGNK